MSEKKKPSRLVHIQEGYQPRLSDLKDKDGKPLQSLNAKDLKPPKGDTAIEPPKPAATDKSSQA